MKRTIPSVAGLDQTLTLRREGYSFIGNACERLGSDIFACRLLLRRAICLRGAAAAEMFYAGDRFTRVGAMPASVLKLLQDYGSVQMLDGAPHRRRKRMLLDVVNPEEVTRLAAHFAQEWERSLDRWQHTGRIVLFDELRPMLTRAVTSWAGIPLDEAGVARRAFELSEMVEATGSFGPRNWRALWLRQRCERWARAIIADARVRGAAFPRNSVVGIIAAHRDLDKALDTKTAAVELLNVLRPVVAVARYIVFAAKALHEHPEARHRIAAGDAAYLLWFVQEVRRLSPFFPFIAGRVRHPFEWRGYDFPKGAWVIFDLYGTNRDPRSWSNPAQFEPERFIEPPNAFELVPQGAGDVRFTHRCPGENLTVQLMQTAVQLLVRSMRYHVPPQDLTVDLARIPALPRSGFVMQRPSRVAPVGVWSHGVVPFL